MEKISSFTITELSVNGFKCFFEPRTFKFGAMNFITGHNGQGKSSLADAIAYAVTGVPFFGTEPNLDRLYSLGTKDVTVSLTIKLPDGSTHQLTRSRVNGHTSIAYDGIQARQSDLNGMFGEKDVFLSIFNPLYFIEVLEEKGRNLLERYLPSVPHERVMENLCEQHRELLAKEQLNSPEFLLEQVRKDIREKQGEVIYTEGQRDLLITQSEDKEQAMALKQEELATVETAIAELEAKRIEGLDFGAMRGCLEEFQVQHNQMTQEASTIPEAYVSPHSQELATANAQFDVVKKRYLQEKAVLDGLRPGICCAYCKQQVTEENIDSLKQTFADSVNALINEGQEMREKLDLLNAKDANARQDFDQNAESRKAALQELDGQIQLWQNAVENGNLGEEDIRELASLRQRQDELSQEISLHLAQQNSGASEDKEEKILNLKRAVEDKRELENALKFYIAERVKLTFADFDLLQHVKVVLYDIVKKTGEVRNTFDFSYDGKPYRFLSLSEKIKAGLEISELLKRLTGSDYPVFIDNGESVPVIDNIRPSGQVFVAQVVKAAPLAVRVPGGMPAAAEKLAA